MDKHICIGNLGAAPKTHEGKDDKEFYSASLGVAVYNGKENETVWYNLTFNDGYKKRINLCTKGTKLYVEGSLKVKTYTNDNGDVKIDRSISVSAMEILGGMKEKEEREQEDDEPKSKKAKKAAKVEQDDDDLPF